MSTEYISKIKAPRLLKKPKIIELTYFIYRFHKFGKLIPTYSLCFYFYCTKFLIFRYLSNDKITITTAIILSICQINGCSFITLNDTLLLYSADIFRAQHQCYAPAQRTIKPSYRRDINANLSSNCTSCSFLINAPYNGKTALALS